MPYRPALNALPAYASRTLASALIGLAVATAVPPSLVAQGAPSASRLLRASDVDTLPLTHPSLRVAYGSDSLQVGELRLPANAVPGTRVPVAVVIHGGCWTAAFATLRNTAALADALAQRGIATWNIEYRRGDSPGGGWTGTFDDVARAADYLRVLARQYPLDTARVVAVGHSAGAQLALWLASRHRFWPNTPSALRVRGVVSLGGITDLDEFAVRQAAGCGRGVTTLFGVPPAQVPERVALVSPIRRLPLGVPSVHVAGDRDAIAPDSVRAFFRRSALAAGDTGVTNLTVPGGHFEVVAPGTDAGRTVIRLVLTLLGSAGP